MKLYPKIVESYCDIFPHEQVDPSKAFAFRVTMIPELYDYEPTPGYKGPITVNLIREHKEVPQRPGGEAHIMYGSLADCEVDAHRNLLGIISETLKMLQQPIACSEESLWNVHHQHKGWANWALLRENRETIVKRR